MTNLVALDVPGGPAFVEALERIWQRGDAAWPVDPRLPDAERAKVTAALAPSSLLRLDHDGSLDAAYEAARDLDRSPLSTIFMAAYAEMNRMARFAGKKSQADAVRAADAEVRGG